MAFIEIWDMATPSNLEGVTQGDDRIRELKRALNERMNSILQNWPATDPLLIKHTAMFNQNAINGVPSATPTTVVVLPAGNVDATYMIHVRQVGGAAAQADTILVTTSSNNTQIVYGEVKPAGSLFTLTIAGGVNVQLAQTTGGSINVIASYRRVLGIL